MPEWLDWIVAAAVLGIGEMLTMGLFLGPFAIGALLAAVVAAIGLGTAGAVIVFVATSLLLLLFVRPIAVRHRSTPPRLRTGTAALVGSEGVVLERINNHEGLGSVRIEGETWTARAYDGQEEIEVGKRVHVLEIRGATALVSE